MILTIKQKFEVELPTGWRELPPTSVLSVGNWIFEWVDESRIPPERKENLIRALGETGDFVLANLSENRTWIALFDESFSRVRGVASIAALNPAEAVASIADQALPIVGSASLFSQTFDATIAGLQAVVKHDIGVYPSLTMPVVAERFVGTLFALDEGSIVQLEILAEALDVFDDIVSAGVSVLDGLRFVDEE